MTVPIQPNEFNYVGDGASTEFAFPSRFAKPEHLLVYVAGMLKVLGINYTVDAGTVTFLPGNIPAVGAAVKIRRNTPAERETAFIAGGSFLRLPVLDDDLDQMAMALQDRTRRLENLEAAVTAGFSGGAGNGLDGFLTVSGDYQVQKNDRMIFVDASANDVTVTLMPAADEHAADVGVKRRDGSDYAAKVAVNPGDQLEDGDEYPLESKWSGGTFRRDGVAIWTIF